MILSTAVYLFSVLCGLVPCEPRYNMPELRGEPRSGLEMVRNLQKRMVEPIVHTKSGIVQGYLMRSTSGRQFFAFEGIPYGETTAGRNRWKSPIPKRPWRGVRQALKPGSECLQFSLQRLLRVHGSEDCLSVNVYAPDLPTSVTSFQEGRGKYPVVVFIHGGSFAFGSGAEYGPSYMLNEDVILVTMNYRLGVMGFLSTGDMHLPGNYGLKDQALALKWIHENIGSFGGNNKNVTLMGNSAGGVSVHLHMISNTTREYYSSALSSSGTAFQHWSVQSPERMRFLGNKMASRFGCQNEDSAKFVQCVNRIDSNFLVAAQFKLFDWFPFPPVLFGPTLEPEHPEAFLTVQPEVAYRQGDVAKKPYIMGATKDEGKTVMLILLPLMRTYPLRTMFNSLAPYFLQYADVTPDVEMVTRKVNEFYLNGTTPRKVNLDTFGEMVTDRYLMFGILKGVQAEAWAGRKPYFYYFSFTGGEQSLASTLGIKMSDWGAGHGDEMYYFFNSSYALNGHKQSDPDSKLSTIMIKLLVNFARTGEPTWTADDGEEYKIWEPVENPEYIKALKFDKEVEMISLPEDQINRLHFWGKLNLTDTSFWSPLKYSKQRQKIDK